MAKNKGFITLRLSLSSIFAIIVIATSILLGAVTFFSIRENLQNNLRQQLHDIVGVAAVKINGDIHNSLQSINDETSDGYKLLTSQLRAIRNVNKDIRFCYTFRFNNEDKVIFVVDAEEKEEDKSHIGDIYDAPEQMILSLKKPAIIRIDDKFYKDKWGVWLSSYAPFFDSAGNISGAVGIDISAAKVFQYEMKLLFLILTITLSISLIVIIIGIIIAKKISNPLKLLSIELGKIQKLNFESEVQVKSNIKEIIEIDNSVGNMKKGLRSFRKYVPKELVSELISLNKEAVLGAERNVLTIFFSDIENFTALSEKLDPLILSEKLGNYFGGMTKIIQDNMGIVDKYIGDCVMAFWGAPQKIDNHEELSCKTALQCQEFVKNISIAFREAKIPVMNTRIGINSGEVVVGNMGYENRLSYTVIGDNVNIASRLEGLNKIYGTNIIISENTYKAVKDKFETRLLDVVAVKGKSKGNKIYELLGEKNNFIILNREYIDLYNIGIEHYLNKNWEESNKIFKELAIKNKSDKPVLILYDRTKKFIVTPPPDNWNGEIFIRDK